MYFSLRRTHKENDLPDKSYLEKLPENEKNSSIAVSKALLKDYDIFVQNSDGLSLGVLRECYSMFTGIFSNMKDPCVRDEDWIFSHRIQKHSEGEAIVSPEIRVSEELTEKHEEALEKVRAIDSEIEQQIASLFRDFENFKTETICGCTTLTEQEETDRARYFKESFEDILRLNLPPIMAPRLDEHINDALNFLEKYETQEIERT